MLLHLLLGVISSALVVSVRPPRGRGVVLRAAVEGPIVPPRSVVDAVVKTGSQRVTAADVATAGGLEIEAARRGLVALAAALQGEASLQVSRDGEIVYAVPRDVRGSLARRSTIAAARDAFDKAKPILVTGARVAFGIALFVSIALVFSAIYISASGGGRDSNDRRGSSSNIGTSVWSWRSSPLDLWVYSPRYRREEYLQEDREMNFLESVFSLVFGDGDPNYDLETKQLSAVAAAARRYGGVLTADQLAPILSPNTYPGDDGLVVDESWVLPALTTLNGKPQVTNGGTIVYVFDDLMKTAAETAKPPEILEEESIPFSLADTDQLVLASLLGAFNLVGVAFLGYQLLTMPPGVNLVGFLGIAQKAFPALAAYAVTFAVAPLVRKFSNSRQNARIDDTNERRRAWLKALKSGRADGRLAQARAFRRKKTIIKPADIVYDSSADSLQPPKDDLKDFDERLQKRREEGEGGGNVVPPPPY